MTKALAILSVQYPKADTVDYELSEGETSIGRQPGNDIVIEERLDLGKAVSRNHCKIIVTKESGSVTIRDVGSANRTSLDGRNIRPHRDWPVKNGSKIVMGVDVKNYSFICELKYTDALINSVMDQDTDEESTPPISPNKTPDDTPPNSPNATPPNREKPILATTSDREIPIATEIPILKKSSSFKVDKLEEIDENQRTIDREKREKEFQKLIEQNSVPEFDTLPNLENSEGKTLSELLGHANQRAEQIQRRMEDSEAKNLILIEELKKIENIKNELQEENLKLEKKIIERTKESQNIVQTFSSFETTTEEKEENLKKQISQLENELKKEKQKYEKKEKDIEHNKNLLKQAFQRFDESV